MAEVRAYSGEGRTTATFPSEGGGGGGGGGGRGRRGRRGRGGGNMMGGLPWGAMIQQAMEQRRGGYESWLENQTQQREMRDLEMDLMSAGGKREEDLFRNKGRNPWQRQQQFGGGPSARQGASSLL